MICTRCGKAFISIRNNALYCSRECSYQTYLERKKQKYQESHITTPIARKCITCGQEYTAINPKRQYCSDKCRKRKWWRRSLSFEAITRKEIQELYTDADFRVWMATDFLKTKGRDVVLEWLEDCLCRDYPRLSHKTIHDASVKIIDNYIKKFNIETPEMRIEKIMQQLRNPLRL